MTVNVAKDTIIKFSLALNMILAVGLIVGSIVMSHFNDDLDKGQNQRRSYNAEQRFMLCSRVGISEKSKQEELDQICAGYQNLDDAYASEKARR